MKSIHSKPNKHESPTSFAERLGEAYADSVSKDHKKKNGQFFTPKEIAHFMASYCSEDKEQIKILDPGAGTAVLSCALVEKILTTKSKVKQIELVVYETDSNVIHFTQEALNNLVLYASDRNVKLTYEIRQNDFILDNAHCFRDKSTDLFSKEIELFDIVISNPPYFKLAKDDLRAIASANVSNGHPNIYSIFMALSAIMLKDNGQLIFITPRSYASGGYFKVFRSFFFSQIKLKNIHLFVSRKDTFSRDKVLQETVIINGFKSETSYSDKTEISTSEGIKDLFDPQKKSYPLSEVIDIQSQGKIMFLPTSPYDEHVLSIFRSWKNKFKDYGIKVSTGPVVAFRARDYLRAEYQNSTVHVAPLIWLHNIKPMNIEWPIVKPKKEQYINVEPKSNSLLVQNKNYVLLRRFSSKDDKVRLVAAPYLRDYQKSDCIGFENKVNYIYKITGELTAQETVGIAALLSSRVYDAYFRIFNGNVNVSATELKEMTLPELDIIQEIGGKIIDQNNYSIDYINKLIDEMIELELAE